MLKKREGICSFFTGEVGGKVWLRKFKDVEKRQTTKKRHRCVKLTESEAWLTAKQSMVDWNHRVALVSDSPMAHHHERINLTCMRVRACVCVNQTYF